MNPAKEWKCPCGVIEIQTGVRALELLPTPPVGWAVIDVTTTLPERSVPGPEGKMKMGEARNVKRYVYCPTCFAKFPGVV